MIASDIPIDFNKLLMIPGAFWLATLIIPILIFCNAEEETRKEAKNNVFIVLSLAIVCYLISLALLFMFWPKSEGLLDFSIDTWWIPAIVSQMLSILVLMGLSCPDSKFVRDTIAPRIDMHSRPVTRKGQTKK
jgi:hypothetical protein